jgi:hypothetical protein
MYPYDFIVRKQIFFFTIGKSASGNNEVTAKGIASKTQ